MPFFLSGGTALGLGRGEEIYPLVDLPTHAVVIVRPPFGVSTAEAYAVVRRGPGGRAARSRGSSRLLPVPWPTRAAQMINDLEPPVVRRHPEIGTLRTALREAGAIAAAMSGSGSAVFGLFRSQAAALKALEPAVARRRAGGAHPNAEPRRVRAEVPSDDPPAEGRTRLTTPGTPTRQAELTGTSATVYTYRFADVPAGRAVQYRLVIVDARLAACARPAGGRERPECWRRLRASAAERMPAGP